MNQEIYKQKYIKYKQKYLELKSIIGGSNQQIIDSFDNAKNSDDISNIIDKLMNIKESISNNDIDNIVNKATSVKNRLTYQVWNKEIRKKFYILLENLRRLRKPADYNIEVYDLKMEDNDKDIEEKMGDLDTEEEMFVSKITDMANDIVGDVIDTVGKMVDGTKTALPRPVEYDLNKLI
jgi:hypothetical protein